MPSRYVKKPRKELLHLPLERWPQRDRELFDRAFKPPIDLFDDAGGGSHLRSRTIDDVRLGWRRWLGWLARNDPEVLSHHPADRITPDVVKAFIAHLKETNGSAAVARQIESLLCACRYMLPEYDWGWLHKLRSRLKTAGKAKKKPPIPITSDRLMDIGEEMMDEAEVRAIDIGQLRRSQQLQLACLHRDGLMISFEALFAPRRTSLAAVQLGRSLIKLGEVWIVDIAEENVKNAQRIRATLPISLSRRLDTHLQVFRPLLPGSSSHAALWASCKGRALGGPGLYAAFKKRLSERAKLNLTLHDSRRIGITTWAVESPETVEGAKDLLGDKSAAVIAQHYNRAGALKASRQMAELIEKRKAR